MKFKPKCKVYIIENGWRITEIQVVSEVNGFCLVRFPTGGGMRISSKRLYATQEEAEKVVEEWRAWNEVKIERPKVQPDLEIIDSSFHSPHYYD